MNGPFIDKLGGCVEFVLSVVLPNLVILIIAGHKLFAFLVARNKITCIAFSF
jgi:hypothetical protein